MTFDQQWIEYDYNPFILFRNDGKIVSLNSEAQYLMGNTDAASIFELATTYASPSFGFNTTFLDLEYGRFKFFGITVGYVDEEEIGIRLYQMPSFRFSKPKETAALVNIFALVDLCISSNAIGKQIKFTKEFDPTIPEIRMQADSFIKFLNKVYQAFQKGSLIHTRIYYRIGEYIRFEDKKYNLISVEVSGEEFDDKRTVELTKDAEGNNYHVTVKKQIVTINLALITD
jgi:nitrogen-specific signal transduction histidine kinase